MSPLVTSDYAVSMEVLKCSDYKSDAYAMINSYYQGNSTKNRVLHEDNYWRASTSVQKEKLGKHLW